MYNIYFMILLLVVTSKCGTRQLYCTTWRHPGLSAVNATSTTFVAQ